ncbi:MAG: hypothetical protein ACREL7_11335 [Longimicrobiales bacterium]
MGDGILGAAGLVDRRRSLLLLAGLIACWLPVLFLRDTIGQAAALHALAETPEPYFVPRHAFLLYVLSPLVVMSACILLLSPGLVSALAVGRARSVDEWILHGFALSLVIVSLATALVQSIAPLDARSFTSVIAACTLLAWIILRLRIRGVVMGGEAGVAPARLTGEASQRSIAWPFAAPYSKSTIAWQLIAPSLILIVLTPKFLWENFNGDGAHAFEAARLLLRQPVPFWPAGAGEIGGFPGLTSALYAYPASWFIRLFGEFEAAARLPYLLYLPPLHAGMLLIIEHGRDWLPNQAERLVLWLCLFVYTIVVAWSATYSPYSADLALPATQDSLLMVCFFGFALATLRREWSWFALFAILTFITLPNGLLMIGFWCAALFLCRRWNRAWACTIALAGLVFFAFAVPRILALAGMPAPGGEYSGSGMLVRFAFLQLTDVRRFLYLLIPCGIVPGIALVMWRRMDDVAKPFALVTYAAFLFAYVQAYAPLHYYIPAMLLPLVAYWRLPATGHRSGREIAFGIAGAIVAFGLSLPSEVLPFTAARPVGEAVDVRVGDYDAMDPAAFRASTLLSTVIPYDWDPAVPETAFGGSPLVFHYYARHRDPAVVPDYVVQHATAAAPAGMREVASDGEFAVWVRSDSVWAAHRAIRPPTPAGSPWVRVPRGLLFRTEPLPEGFLLISLPAIAAGLGIDVEGLARRLGVR